MKGMFAILGCLFAAYAAPLFANEVPLILEETIQLPVVPDAWDVALSNDSEYMWAAALSWDNESYIDSLTRYYWGSSQHIGVVDSSSSVPGRVSLIEIFKYGSDSLGLFGVSSYCTGFSMGDGICRIDLFSFVTDRSIGSRDWSNYCDSHNPQCVYQYRVRASLLVPPYPQQTEEIHAVWNYRLRNLPGDQTPNAVWRNVFENGSYTWIAANVHLAASSQWAGHPYFVIQDDFQIVRRCYFEGESLVTTSAWQVGWLNIEMLPTWDEVNDRALVVVKKGDSLLAFEAGFHSALWRHATTYTLVILGDAVQGLSGEELLVAEPQFSILHILNPRTYTFWGQTGHFEPGFDEIKVVSRYHNETRRLVVRYGSELRIYRFGDPIYTDADDARPELPTELTLSAYPNPFNPVTTIAFDLPTTSQAQLTMYDLTGRVVQTLFNERMTAGHHEVAFDGASLPSGLYFARLEAGNLTTTQKLVLLK